MRTTRRRRRGLRALAYAGLAALPVLGGCGGGGGWSSSHGAVIGYLYTKTGNLTGYLGQPASRAAGEPNFVLLSEAPDGTNYVAVPDAKMSLTDAAWIAYAAWLEAQQENSRAYPSPVPAGRATTDADGKYDFMYLPAGKYQLTIELGREPVTLADPVTVYPGQTARGAETPNAAPADLIPQFSLLGQPMEGTPTIAPVAAATVTLRNTGRSMVTGPDGGYGFSRLREGYYFLDVTKDGFQTRDFYLTVIEGETTWGPFAPLRPTHSNDDYGSDGSGTNPPPTNQPPSASDDDGGSYNPADEGDSTGDEDDVGDTLGQTVLHPHTSAKR